LYPYISILLIVFVGAFEAPAQSNPPKYELRAVWLTTVMGLDWPPSNLQNNIPAQQSALIDILETVHRANMNALFFQVHPRGNVLYRSLFEPWAAELTGTLGKNPGWDPLQFAIEECHKRGLELHAWVNMIKVWSGATPPPQSTPLHVVLAHPEWVQFIDNGWWLDPGIPEVRKYLFDLMMELVRNYDIDGLHFDYLRYPGKKFNDEATYQKYGNRLEKEEWRRENLNQFVREIYDAAIKLKPMLKIGSAPLGIYKNISGANGLQAYEQTYQDSRRWLAEGKHDYVSPQIYWDIGNNGDPDFAALVRDWQNNAYGRHVYPGIAAYRDKVRAELPEEIDVTRNAGALGNVYFRYEHIERTQIFGGRYLYPAIIPPMKWKDNTSPNAPRDVTAAQIGLGRMQLHWKESESAADGDRANRYCIYRSAIQNVDTNNPAHLLAILPNSATDFTDNVRDHGASHFHYVITALDKGNNESTPSNEITIVLREFTEIAHLFSSSVLLSQNYPNPAYENAFIAYQLNDSAQVSLKIHNLAGEEMKSVIEEKQDPGQYIVTVATADLPEGIYTYTLKAGNVSETKGMVVRRRAKERVN
jgi:uncharacterized lipoprotein YddW (UPF0748 family)